jgi:hypothetical protein
MGNEGSKGGGSSSASASHSRRSSVSVSDGAGVGVGGNSRSNSVHLDGHTPYHPHRSPAPPSSAASASSVSGPAPVPSALSSFDEDRHTDLAYSALDDGPVSLGGRPRGNARQSLDLSDEGPISLGGRRGGNARKSLDLSGEIVSLSHLTSAEENEAAMMHPEVEALLNLAQFYPSDPVFLQRFPPPPDARQVTPTLLKPKALMDVYSTMQHRWAGVGHHAIRAQVMIGKDMDKLEHTMQQCVPMGEWQRSCRVQTHVSRVFAHASVCSCLFWRAVQSRNMELRQLNAQLQQRTSMRSAAHRSDRHVQRAHVFVIDSTWLTAVPSLSPRVSARLPRSVPDLHTALQRQQLALAKCLQTMEELKFVTCTCSASDRPSDLATQQQDETECSGGGHWNGD